MNGDQRNLFETTFDRTMAKAEAERGEALAVSALVTWHDRADAWVGPRVGQVVTADDLVADVGLPTREDGTPSNNGIGGYFAGLRSRGVIRMVGTGTSARVTSHGRILREWLVLRSPKEA